MGAALLDMLAARASSLFFVGYDKLSLETGVGACPNSPSRVGFSGGSGCWLEVGIRHRKKSNVVLFGGYTVLHLGLCIGCLLDKFA